MGRGGGKKPRREHLRGFLMKRSLRNIEHYVQVLELVDIHICYLV